MFDYLYAWIYGLTEPVRGLFIIHLTLFHM